MAIPRSDQKRQKILEAALNLFSINGYSNTTINNIAKEAGVSFGTVFTYFDTKENLFNICVQNVLDDFSENIIKNSSEDFNSLSLSKLEKIVDDHVRYVLKKEKELRLIQYVLSFPKRFTVIQEVNNFADEFIQYIQKLVESGIANGFLPSSNTLEVAHGYLAFLNGIRLTYTDFAQVVYTDTFKKQALRLFGIV